MFFPLQKLEKINKNASVKQTKWKLSKVKTLKLKLISCPFFRFNLKRELTKLKVFIANNPDRVYREMISKTWKFEQAQNKIKRSSESRISRNYTS